jgi:hypothetical protein
MAGNPNPSFTLNVINTGIAPAPAGGGNSPLVIGTTSQGSFSGSPGVGIAAYTSIQSLTNTLGSYGNAVDAATLDLAQGAPSVLVYKAFSGSIGSTTASGGGSNSDVTFTGQPTAPFGLGQDGSGIVVQITTGGARGTSQFNYSLDGGVSFGGTQVTAATVTLVGTGVTVAFASVSSTVGWSYVAPIMAATGQMYPYSQSAFSIAQTTATGSTATTGEGTFIPAGSANPIDAFNVLIDITKTGTLAADSAQYTYSLDGGITTSSVQTITGATVTLPGGVVLTAQDTNTTASYEWIDSTDTNTVTFAAGTSYLGAAGNNLKVVVATGSALANSIATVGNITTVTLTIDTTVTTPALLATYVNTTAAATLAPYISISAHTGTTAFTVFLASTALAGGYGNGGSQAGFVAGEQYSFSTLGPQLAVQDIVNILGNLIGNTNTWGWIHISQQCNTVNSSASVGFDLSTLFTDINVQALAYFAANQYTGTYFLIDSPPDTVKSNIDSTLETWAATAASDYISVGLGNAAATASPANGWQLPRGSSWSLSARLCTTPLGTDPAWVATGPLGGISQIYRNEATTPGLGPAGFVPLWTINGLQGFYITNGNILCSNTSDISLSQYRRVLNAACAASYKALVMFLSGYVRTVSGGKIDPRDVAIINNVTQAAALQAVNGQCQTVICSLSNVIGAGGSITMQTGIVPFGYIKAITENIGFISPALAAASS